MTLRDRVFGWLCVVALSQIDIRSTQRGGEFEWDERRVVGWRPCSTESKPRMFVVAVCRRWIAAETVRQEAKKEKRRNEPRKNINC